MGDPSYEYEHTDVRRIRDGDEYTEEEVTVSTTTNTVKSAGLCLF